MSENAEKILDAIERIIRIKKIIEEIAKKIEEREKILDIEFEIPYNKNIDIDDVELTLKPPENKKVIIPRIHSTPYLYEEREIVEIELNGWRLDITTRSKEEGNIVYTISLKEPSMRDLLILASNPKILDIVEEELKKIDRRIEEDIEKLRKIVSLVETAMRE